MATDTDMVYVDRVCFATILKSGPSYRGTKSDITDCGIDKGVLWAVPSQRVAYSESEDRYVEISDEGNLEDGFEVLDLPDFYGLTEHHPFDKDYLTNYLRAYADIYLGPRLYEEERHVFHKNIDGVIEYLGSRIEHLVPYTVSDFYDANTDEGIKGLVEFKDTSTNPPTFLYLAHGLWLLGRRFEDDHHDEDEDEEVDESADAGILPKRVRLNFPQEQEITQISPGQA